jgi:hypothetical protein
MPPPSLYHNGAAAHELKMVSQRCETAATKMPYLIIVGPTLIADPAAA